jgi:hypothetical protein
MVSAKKKINFLKCQEIHGPRTKIFYDMSASNPDPYPPLKTNMVSTQNDPDKAVTMPHFSDVIALPDNSASFYRLFRPP